MAHRPEPPTVAAIEHFALVARHVDAGRAVGCAGLARQAEIQRLGQLRGVPTLHERAVHHLLQDPGASTSGVLLVLRGLVARAHEATAGGQVGPALPHTRAAMDGIGETAAVVHESHATRRQDGTGLGQTQIGGNRYRLDQHARVEDVVRIHQPLELAEQVEGLARVHVLQQRAPGPAVTVLTGQRSAVGRDELGGSRDELLEDLRAVGQREVDAHVDAAVAEVPVRQGRRGGARPSAR